MIDVVTVGAGGGSIAWLSPEGTLKVGPHSRPAPTRARCATAAAATEPTVTDAHVVLGRIPPHLLGGEMPLDVGPGRATGIDALGAAARARPASAAPPAILEISAWNQANALRQVTVKRGLDVRDFTLVTFGGSGLAAGLPAGRHPRPRRRAGAARTRATCRRSACSPSTSATTTCRPRSPGTPTLDRRPRAGGATTRWPARPTRRWTREGFARGGAACSCAPPTCATSARPSRCASTCPTGRSTGELADDGRRRASTTRTGRSTATTSATTRGRQVEWVNLRVTGVGPIRKPSLRRGRGRARGVGPRATGTPPGVLRRLGRTPPSTTGPGSAPGDVVDGPGGHRGVRLDRPAAPRLHRPRRRLRQPADHRRTP